jgi:hypothetical protein
MLMPVRIMLMPVRIMPVLVVVLVVVFMLVLQGDLDLFLAAAFTATISRIAGLGDTCIGCKD